MIVLTDCCKSTGQPRRHLLQSGWSVFVGSKRLVPEDAFIFLRSDVASFLPNITLPLMRIVIFAVDYLSFGLRE
jgi:hypothetical protein